MQLAMDQYFPDLCRGQEYGPLYVVFFMHVPTVVILKPEDIKVHMHKNNCGIHGNFHQEKIFTHFAICSYWRNFYHTNFLSYINDYIEDMATFTALVKIYSIDYFCNTKVSGLGEIFV